MKIKSTLFVLILTMSYNNAFCQLQSISPNIAQLGQTNFQTTITGNNLFFVTASPTGNISDCYLRKSPYSIYFNPSSYLYINNNNVSCSFNIPLSSTYLGTYNLTLDLKPSPTYYYLYNSFNVILPNIYITGNVFYDVNQNGVKDIGEVGLPNKTISSFTTTSTDNNGDYYLFPYISGGTYNLNLNTTSGLTTTTPNPLNVPNVTGPSTGNDFGVISSLPNYSCSVNLTGGFPRCNQDVSYSIHYNNTSNITYDGIVKFILADSVTYISSNPVPTSIIGDTLFYNFSNVQPFSVNNPISVILKMPSFIPQTIINIAQFTSLDGSGIPVLTQTSSLSQTVACSFDPNDKSVTPPGFYSQHYTLFTDTLEYLIRFQNTGNDTAFTVVIRDQLDDDLLLSSFEVVGSSHNMTSSLLPTGSLTFRFNNILLVDSNVNEPESHGWVKFRIRPKSGLAPNTIVTNESLIFFDSNAPVVTNSVFNTLVAVIPVGINEPENTDEKDVVVMPNPASNETHLFFKNSKNELFYLDVFGVDKRKVHKDVTQTGHFFIDTKTFKSGIYFYSVYDKNKTYYSGKFIVE